MFSILVVARVSQIRHIAKLIEMYILSMYNISYINYILRKLKTIELELNIWFLFVFYLDFNLQKGRDAWLILTTLYSMYSAYKMVNIK